MNRLESIKDNMESCTDWYVDNSLFLDDMKWLIQRLERYEEALKEASTIIHDYKEARGYRERQVLEIADIIKEALKE